MNVAPPWRGLLLLSGIVAAQTFLPAALLGKEEITLRDGWEIQSSEKVVATPEQISRAGFSISSWYKTSVPKTVVAALVENSVYPDPYFGMNLRSLPGVSYPIGAQFANLEMPPDGPFAQS